MMKKISKVIGNSIKYLSLFLWSAIVLLPIITIIFGAFKTYDEFVKTSGMTPPEQLTNFENFNRVFIQGKMFSGFMNTFFIMLISITVSLFLGSMVAYILNRFDFKYKKLILFIYLLVSIVPVQVSQVTTFKLIDAMGLYNTRWAPILLYIGTDLTMIYIYLQALQKIPKELDKAAMLEGASYFKIYQKIIFPLLKPATATIIMLKVIGIYNDFYIPFLYMPGESLNTVSTSLFRFMGPFKTEWNTISAGILISMIPMILFFLVLQKQIYKGLTEGSIK